MAEPRSGSTTDDLGLPVVLTPKQRQVVLSNEDQVFFGGGRNCGKSTTANWLVFSLANYYLSLGIPAQLCIFRRIAKQLSGGLIQTALSTYPWPRQYFSNYVKPGAWQLPIVKEGKDGAALQGYVQVRYLQAEHENDVLDYVGESWALLLIDQVEAWTPQMVEILMTNVRTSDPRIHPVTRLFGNWGGVCHQWLLDHFYTPVGADGVPLQAEIGKPFAIPYHVQMPNGRTFSKDVTRLCLVGDFTENPHIDQAAYAAQLKQTSAHLWRLWGEADPYGFEGQLYPEWNKAVHVVDQPFAIPLGWEHHIAVDYGISAPFCALFLAKDPKTRQIYVYKEIYQRGLTAEQQMGAIGREVMRADVNVRFFVCDYQMWARESTGFSPIAYYRKAARDLSLDAPFVKANKDRVSNIQLVHKHLTLNADGKPGLQIFSSCRNLIRQMGAMRPSPTNAEDAQTGRNTEDHAHDALLYGLASFGRTVTKPVVPNLYQVREAKEEVAETAPRPRKEVLTSP